jgi:hypothetical protein
MSAEQPPPFFETWNKLYGFVLGVLAALILLFYLFSITFR